MGAGAAHYDDGRIACDDTGILIRWYYPWGAKRIPYHAIRSVTRLPLTGLSGRWRIWGSGDLVHWWHLDPSRPRKRLALVLDTGRHVQPTITPDDPEELARILADRMGR